MRRREIRWYTFAPPDKRRPILVLARDEIADALNELIVVPATRTIRGIATEVVLTEEDGMPLAVGMTGTFTRRYQFRGLAPADWSAYLGHCVNVEGYPSRRMVGPYLERVPQSIGVSFADPSGHAEWEKLGEARVRVQGVVTERADLPVFIRKAGKPMVQGIPVPEGTNLEKARRRFVIEVASALPLRTPKEVQRDLTARLGQGVRLTGVLWNRNDQWWFNHDGVKLHLSGPRAVFDADMHARPVVIEGRLERRALPRLDQIAEKPKPDLADAFVIEVRAVTPHPAFPITECARSPE